MHQDLDVPIARAGERTHIVQVGNRVIEYDPENQGEAKALSAYVPSVQTQQ